MSAQNKIEKYNLGSECLKLIAVPGATTHSVAAQLTERLEGRDTISQSTVSRWLQAERRERREETRKVVDEHIKEHVPKDLSALEEIETWLLGIFRNQAELLKLRPELAEDPEIKKLVEKIQGENTEAHDLRTRADAAMKAVKVIELKLKYAGILEDPTRPKALDDLSDEELEERLNGIGS